MAGTHSGPWKSTEYGGCIVKPQSKKECERLFYEMMSGNIPWDHTSASKDRYRLMNMYNSFTPHYIGTATREGGCPMDWCIVEGIICVVAVDSRFAWDGEKAILRKMNPEKREKKGREEHVYCIMYLFFSYRVFALDFMLTYFCRRCHSWLFATLDFGLSNERTWSML